MTQNSAATFTVTFGATVLVTSPAFAKAVHALVLALLRLEVHDELFGLQVDHPVLGNLRGGVEGGP